MSTPIPAAQGGPDRDGRGEPLPEVPAAHPVGDEVAHPGAEGASADRSDPPEQRERDHENGQTLGRRNEPGHGRHGEERRPADAGADDDKRLSETDPLHDDRARKLEHLRGPRHGKEEADDLVRSAQEERVGHEERPARENEHHLRADAVEDERAEAARDLGRRDAVAGEEHLWNPHARIIPRQRPPLARGMLDCGGEKLRG